MIGPTTDAERRGGQRRAVRALAGLLDGPLPYRHGHMRRRHACVTCDGPTRRTVGLPGHAGRYVLCARCELPGPEARLLLAIAGVETLPALEARR